MTYITGDKHGDFKEIKRFVKISNLSKDDVVIVLGDSGVNYYTDLRSRRYKHAANELGIKLFCIHGNHEARTETLSEYIESEFWGGRVLVDPEFPNTIFAIDGEVYQIPTKNGIKETLVIGGAYSVDKMYRISRGYNWYNDEQPSDEIKNKVEKVLEERNLKIDIILSHTCPLRYEPIEWFLSGIRQDLVDKSTEEWFDKLLDKIIYFEKWYCGHYHGDKQIDKIEFMFHNIKEL